MSKIILKLFSLVDDSLSKPFVFDLGNKTVTIGRSRENDILIPDGFLAHHISRKHGKIALEDGKVIYTDASSQGTVYSGRFGMKLLRDGEKIEILNNDFILLPNNPYKYIKRKENNESTEDFGGYGIHISTQV